MRGSEGLGRSRGGLSTEVHLTADLRCRPISPVTTPGQRNDALFLGAVMAGIRIQRPGPGRPRTRPDRVLADKAYSSQAIRCHLRRRGIKTTVPVPADQQGHRARRGKGGRLPKFDSSTTHSATSSSAPSTSSDSSARSPPDTANASTPTRAPSMSPRSESGSRTPPDLRDTPIVDLDVPPRH